MTLSDSEFLAAFERATLPEEQFHHADHVRLAWLYLRIEAPLAAAARFAEGLRRFATAKGRDGLYHETITCAYLFLIHERMARGPADEDFAAFAHRNGDLLTWRPSVLESYYRPETLESELARRVFVLPDRAAL